ncbi:hypothetical protein B0H13DRAFT_2305818 [Mycena leptocephala]|nr:hypothetical protein B0H13DRAFT_2305818 [Mycena leptocephala]
MDGLEKNGGPLASNNLNSDLPEQDSIPDNDDESEHDAEEDEDFSAESPTLTRFNADDVALDMDIHEWYLDGDDAGSVYDGGRTTTLVVLWTTTSSLYRVSSSCITSTAM